jgi:hypothetical protein
MLAPPDSWEAEARVKTHPSTQNVERLARYAGETENSVFISPEELERMHQRGGAALAGVKIPVKVPDISATLAERGGRYGQFINHSKISQGLQDVMREAPNWDKLEVDMRQALTTIVDKLARILNGDPYYDDSWHDIQGYAKLVEDRLLKMKEGQ